tara:strand:+ start:695 stop:1210 length:516 start_codon:yes stop_codon:yes gene_type:complete
MRQLVNVNNVDVPSSDYPKGRVRDKVGATLGTEYSEILHGDIIQFFQKLIIDASITENDLPDNVANGYQLLEALNARIKVSSALVEEYNNAFNSGNIDLNVENYDRHVYAQSSGSIPTGYTVLIKLDGTQILRIDDYDSQSWVVPAGVACQLTVQTGTSSGFEINSQKIGI